MPPHPARSPLRDPALPQASTALAPRGCPPLAVSAAARLMLAPNLSHQPLLQKGIRREMGLKQLLPQRTEGAGKAAAANPGTTKTPLM